MHRIPCGDGGVDALGVPTMTEEQCTSLNCCWNEEYTYRCDTWPLRVFCVSLWGIIDSVVLWLLVTCCLSKTTVNPDYTFL